MNQQLLVNNELMSNFITEVKAKYPKKSFGYFVSQKPNGNPTDFIIFTDDVRDELKDTFEAYGNYYKRNNDAGFLATEEEIYMVHKKLAKEKLHIVGVFHSHQRHPAIFSKVDVDFHPSESIWHLIISLRNINNPQIKVFKLENSDVKEIPIIKEVNQNKDEIEQLEFLKNIKNSKNNTEIYEYAKEIFGFNSDGNPKVVNGEILYKTWNILKDVSKEMEEELMFERFYKNSKERYIEFIEPIMKNVQPKKFTMGTNNDSEIKYCGESPEHTVILNPFAISSIPITNEIYFRYNPFYTYSTDSKNPVANISWYDSVMFSKWVGCRLLTEAEWEYASCKLEDDLWCCKEDKLSEYAWYSENSDGVIHKVAQLKPNNFGIYDMHGNTWEWAQDSYSEDYYNIAPYRNPKNDNGNIMKVCRGGSMHAFSDMCRSSFRYYEPANYKAPDISFRVAKDLVNV